jgi:hypothetical protein
MVGNFREIDTEIFFLGDEREDIARFFALRDEEARGDVSTHWGIVHFSRADVEKMLTDDGLTITKLRLVAMPEHQLPAEEMLKEKIYQEADYEKPGEWISLDDLHILDQEMGTL